jgi:hypothetical protein
MTNEVASLRGETNSGHVGHVLFVALPVPVQVILAALISAGVMLVLSSAVAFLGSLHLARYFQLFCVLQDLAVIGADGAKSAPIWREQLVTAFRYASLLNFDVSVLKPGCAGIPSFSFVDKFIFTLVAVAITAAMFALAALLRTWLRNKTESRAVRQACTLDQLTELQREVSASDLHDAENHPALPFSSGADEVGQGAGKRASYLRRDSALSPAHVSLVQRTGAWTAFRRRLQHALIILLCIFYLRICILQLQVSLQQRIAHAAHMKICCGIGFRFGSHCLSVLCALFVFASVLRPSAANGPRRRRRKVWPMKWASIR